MGIGPKPAIASHGDGRLQFEVLGPVRVVGRTGDPIALSRSQCLIVAALAAHLGRPVSVDRLAEALWGEALSAGPAASVRSLIARLRQALHESPSPLVTDAAGYRLDVERDQLDAAKFEDLIAAAGLATGTERLALLDRSLTLWKGQAYGGFSDSEMLQAEARRLEEVRSVTSERRAEALLAFGRTDDAVVALGAVLADHPDRERTRALLMEALAAIGRHSEALEVYESWRLALAKRGLHPSPALRESEANVLRHTATVPAAPSWRSTLPRPISSFVGREADCADVVSQMQRSRFVTLVGVGGVGKTRLAVAAADAAAGRYPDGVWFCDLTSATIADDVPRIVATTIGVREHGADPLLIQIARHLSERTALVVLDNCERVRSGAATIAEALTSRTSGVDVLATSRRRLGADGEVVHPVDPLPAEDEHSPAAQLFTDRRVAIAGPQPLVGSDPAVLSRICRKLDGLPLAIELAAARLRGLTLAELEARLDQRFTLLVDENRSQSRHRSLAAMIDWSNDELNEPTRSVFRRLGVFRSAFDVECAAEVLGATGLAAGDVADALLTLVDCSLLRWTVTPAGSRYSTLDSIREFAVERMREADELEQVGAAHAAWAVRFCEAAEVALGGPQEVEWAQAIYAHFDDLRAAFDWLIGHTDDSALRLVSALHFFALWRNESEVFRWADQAVAALGRSGSVWLAPALGAAGTGAWQRGDFESAGNAAEMGAIAAAAHDDSDPSLRRRPLDVAGDIALLTGDIPGAVDCYARARDLALAAGDLPQAVWDEGSRALSHSYGRDLVSARAASASTLALARSSASPTLLGFAYWVAAEIELETDPTVALRHLDRAAVHSAQTGSSYVASLAKTSRASHAGRSGNVAVALQDYETALAAFIQAGSWSALSITVRSLVSLLLDTGAASEAAVLYGSVVKPTTGPVPYGTDAERLATAAARLVADLGLARFDSLTKKGRALSERQLGDRALRAIRVTLAARSEEPDH